MEENNSNRKGEGVNLFNFISTTISCFGQQVGLRDQTQPKILVKYYLLRLKMNGKWKKCTQCAKFDEKPDLSQFAFRHTRAMQKLHAILSLSTDQHSVKKT